MDHVAQNPDTTPPTQTCDFWEHDSTGSREEDLVRKRSWRVGQERVQSLRDIVQQFEGTHNYHNFTAGRDYSDPSCKRHMKKIQVSHEKIANHILCSYEMVSRYPTRSSMGKQSGLAFFFTVKASCCIK